MRARTGIGARSCRGSVGRPSDARFRRVLRVLSGSFRELGNTISGGGDRRRRRVSTRLGASFAGMALLLSSIALPVGSVGRIAASSVAVVMATALAGAALARGFGDTTGARRLFWVLLGGGTLIWFTGMAVRNGSELLAQPVRSGWTVQVLAHVASSLMLLGALVWLSKQVRHEMAIVDLLDALSVMLGSGLLLWYSVLSLAGPTTATELRELAPLLRAVGDLGLSFLALRVMTTVRTPLASLLTGGMLLVLALDGLWLVLWAGEPLPLGGWSGLYWILTVALLGYAALRDEDTTCLPDHPYPGRIGMLLFWLGPVSPPLQYGVILLWGSLRPPLPDYVLFYGFALLLVFAVRTYAANRANDLLALKQKALARQAEQNRILGELHDTVKQNIRGTSMMIEACVSAQESGDADTLRSFLDKSLEMSREAGYQLSKPLDELCLSHEGKAASPTSFFKKRFEKFGKDFGLEAHENLQAPLEMLNGSELAVAHRVCIEASWNAVKHSGARNLWLESRLVGTSFVIRFRDDGYGFKPQENSQGLGLRFMRSRAEKVGADLDLLSAPGEGTTVRLRFGAR